MNPQSSCVDLHDVLAVERELCTRTKKSVFCHWRNIRAVSCDLLMAARVADKLRAARFETILIDNTPPPSYNAWQEIYLAQVTERLSKDWPFHLE
jgi:hypothetical protein